MFVPFIAACLTLCPTVSGADSGWVLWDQSLYRANPDEIGELKYDSAVRICESYCAHLALPSSKAENDFIWTLYHESSPTDGMWTGCFRNDSGKWGCAEDGVAGIDTHFRNWSPSHEREHFLPNRLCSVIALPGIADKGGQWRAMECYRNKWVVCEKPLRHSTGLPDLCSTAVGDGQSCLTAKLLSVVQSKHLSKVAIHAGGSRYSITPDSDPCNQTTGYLVLSRNVEVDEMKTVSWSIAIQYAKEKPKRCVTGPP